MKTSIKLLLLSAAIASSTNLHAAEPPPLFQFTDGNLILGIQATAGTGTDKNVFFDLGPAVNYRDNGAQGSLGNIGATLSIVYGSDWHTREDIWFGVIGNLNAQPNSGIGSRAAVDGDPSRTIYLSTAAPTPGQGSLLPPSSYGSESLGGAGGNVGSMENMLLGIDNGWTKDGPDELARGLYQEADGAAILNGSLQQHATAWNNSWTKWNPTPGASFEILAKNIQQNFSGSDNIKYVDVQRVLSTTTGANPTGIKGGGTYETTIGISSSGEIISLIPSAGTSPFQTWVATFPALVNSPNAADRTPQGDFDKDGIPNVREFAFGGSPVSGSDNGQQQIRTVAVAANSPRVLTRTVEVRAGATFEKSGNKLTATVDGVVYTIEGSLDLVNFESAVSEVVPSLGTGSPKTGYVFKTFRLDASSGLNGKGFIRAGAAVQ